ncbi:MAG: MFS transporter [Idiomarina sp.]|nr:MFS transporter [Idiomarina sp.]
MRNAEHPTTERLYRFLAEDEDARVCKDIPDEACDEQPRAFVLHLLALTLTKLGDSLVSARLVLPWMLTAAGAPAFFISLLVPLRESLSLLPQLFVAARMRARAIRKWFWVLGSLGQAFSLVAMAMGLWFNSGVVFAYWVVGWLIVFSLARGICSVASKDVLGKTISKSRRGRLTGLAASIAGFMTLVTALLIIWVPQVEGSSWVFAGLLLGAASLWSIAAVAYAAIPEAQGATEGGANAIEEAFKSLKLVATDKVFGHFVFTRALLISSAFAIPYMVVLIQRQSENLTSLGALMLASGLAGLVAGRFWGHWSDRASHHVMAAAAILSAVTMVATLMINYWWSDGLGQIAVGGALIFLAATAHQGARVGRKTYLVDMATQDNRAQLTAVSNTLIGGLLLLGGLLGIVDQWLGTQTVMLLLVALSLLAAWRAFSLPSVAAD